MFLVMHVEENQYQQNLHYDLPEIYALSYRKGKKSKL